MLLVCLLLANSGIFYLSEFDTADCTGNVIRTLTYIGDAFLYSSFYVQLIIIVTEVTYTFIKHSTLTRDMLVLTGNN